MGRFFISQIALLDERATKLSVYIEIGFSMVVEYSEND